MRPSSCREAERVINRDDAAGRTALQGLFRTIFGPIFGRFSDDWSRESCRVRSEMCACRLVRLVRSSRRRRNLTGARSAEDCMWAITKATRLAHGGFARFARVDGQSGAWALPMTTYRLTATQSIPLNRYLR